MSRTSHQAVARFGLDAALIDRLVREVSDTDTDAGEPSARQERFARGAWSMLAEPGDGTAGLLLGTLGAAAALDHLVQRHPAERILAAVADADRGATDGLASELAAGLQRWSPRLASAQVVTAFELAARVSARLMTREDDHWPTQLDDLGRHAPLVLWRRGSREACRALTRSISVVGARAASGYGEHVALEFAAGLVDRGFAIVSGAAYGIDGAAHRSALANGGVTAAFLAGGADRFYPSGHDGLLTRIVESGVVLSEVACGSAPTRWRFLQRNRLIAAASSATIVVEAGHRSGSLNTAGHAAALGRALGAVPGPITSPASAGCHRLIRDYDAVCVTAVDEVVELVDGPAADCETAREGWSAEQTRVHDALSTRSARNIADIAARCGLSVATTSAVLGGFELDGVVIELENGWVSASGAIRR
jgi:DNA processing protein